MNAKVDNATDFHRQYVRGEPAWEIATLYPIQGTWAEAAYLALPTNHMLELNNGCLEILPPPTYFHELIVEFLYDLLGWIIDPELRMISVLELVGDAYRVSGEFKTDQTATSILLPGFSVSVEATFAAGEAQ